MAHVHAKVHGAKEIIQNLDAIKNRWQNAVATGLYLESNNLMGLSKRLTPVDIGALRASGYVTLPEMHGSLIIVELGYGGDISRTYAVVQHERLDFHHEVGQAKYLFDAAAARSQSLANNITQLAKAAFEANRAPQRTTMPVNPSEGEQMYAAQSIGKFLQAFGGSPKGGKK